MENKNDNLGNFFRKKFDDFEGSSEGWNKPDREVRDEVLSQISTPIKPTPKYKGLFLKGLLGLAVLAMVAYIWYLHRQLGELNTSLSTHNEQLINVNNELADLTEKHAQEKTTLLLEKEQLQIANRNYAQQNTKLEQLVQQQSSTISQIQKEHQVEKNNFENAALIFAAKNQTLPILPITEEKRDKDADLAQARQKEVLKLMGTQNIPSRPLQLLTRPLHDFSAFKKTAPFISTVKKRAKFEVGYAYALQTLNIPVSRAFENQRSASDNVQSNEINAPSHGLYFAYSPFKNWWIRAGAQLANITIQRDFRLGLAYDNSNEVINTLTGDTHNELTLVTSTPYTEAKSVFGIVFPRTASGGGLENGDLLEARITDIQQLKYYQVPMGLAHYQGIGKLQLLIQGGLQWNKVVFGEYIFRASVFNRGREIAVERAEVLSMDVSSKQFMSTYAGIGLNYHLFSHWHARAAFTYNYNFININTPDFSSSSKAGTAFKLGLNYRF